MTKEEILAKRILKFPEALNMTDEAIKRNVGKAMQEYADLRCKPLLDCLNDLKKRYGNSEWIVTQIEQALQDYNKK